MLKDEDRKNIFSCNLLHERLKFSYRQMQDEDKTKEQLKKELEEAWWLADELPAVVSTILGGHLNQSAVQFFL